MRAPRARVSNPSLFQEPLCFLLCLTSLMQPETVASPVAGTPAGTVALRACGLRVH
jgi:hypothetical protein